MKNIFITPYFKFEMCPTHHLPNRYFLNKFNILAKNHPNELKLPKATTRIIMRKQADVDNFYFKT